MTKFLGVQLGPHSPFDEGIDHCLDTLQETAGINALFCYATSACRASSTPIATCCPSWQSPRGGGG